MTAKFFRIPGSSLLLALALLAPTTPVSAQSAPLNAGLSADGQFGFHLFQLLLEHKGLRSVTEFDDAVRGEPVETVLVLAGDLDWMLSSEWSQVFRFIERGGAVLVASDRGVYASGLFRLNGGPLSVNDEANAYQGFRDCPILDKVTVSHSLTQNVSQIIANRSGWITRAASPLGSWNAIARLSDFAATDESGTDREFSGAPIIAELVTDNRLPGRLLLAADHSLFLNGMLWHGSNAMFAINTVDWLCQDGRRRTLYFSVDGAPSRSGIPIPQIPPDSIPPDAIPPMPENIPPFSMEDLANTPPESLITFANTLLTGLEDENVFNQVLAHHAADLPLTDYRRQLYLAMAGMAGFWLIRQLLRRGRRFEAPVSRNTVPAVESRVQDLVNSNDLQRPLRELARDLFRTLTGSDDQQDWSVWPQAAGVSGLQRLEKIALNIDRRPVSRREFRRMVNKIERIRQMHEDGQLTKPTHASGPGVSALKERLRPTTQ